MRYSRPLATLFSLLIAVAALSAPARAEIGRGVVLSYEMWQGGFQPFKIELRLASSAEVYRASFIAETSGVVGWAYPYWIQALSEGRSGQAGLAPASYRSVMRRPDKERERLITYGDKGNPKVVFNPPRTGTDEDAPTEAQIANTLDPVSGLVAVMQRIRDGGRCAGVVPVFDGKQAYNLHAKDQGVRRIKANDFGLYSGEATVCRVSMEKVAGFRKKKKKRFAVQYFPQEMDILFGEAVPGQGPVPVRMEGKTDLGGVVVHLVKVDRNPTTWEAMVPKRPKQKRRRTWDGNDSDRR